MFDFSCAVVGLERFDTFFLDVVDEDDALTPLLCRDEKSLILQDEMLNIASFGWEFEFCESFGIGDIEALFLRIERTLEKKEGFALVLVAREVFLRVWEICRLESELVAS